MEAGFGAKFVRCPKAIRVQNISYWNIRSELKLKQWFPEAKYENQAEKNGQDLFCLSVEVHCSPLNEQQMKPNNTGAESGMGQMR